MTSTEYEDGQGNEKAEVTYVSRRLRTRTRPRSRLRLRTRYPDIHACFGTIQQVRGELFLVLSSSTTANPQI